MYFKLSIILLVVIFLVGINGALVLAAPKPDLWPRWETNYPSSAIIIDHTPWNQILSKYLVTDHPTGVNRFRYSSVTTEDKKRLEDYLVMLQHSKVSGLNRAEQKAYWINLYNSLTVKVILDHYPVKSIRDIDLSPGWFKDGPWDAGLLWIEGEDITLNDIEHRILRPIWKDERVHYALNCASIGCPDLQPEAYTAENTERLLEKGAREYVNHPRGVSIKDSTLTASKIYDWFQIDFGGSKKGVLQHLSKYAEDSMSDEIKRFKGKTQYKYDWSLNE